MARRVPPPPPLPDWDAAPAYTIAKAEFAADMEVTRAAVSQWIARGLPVRPDGLLDLEVAAQWLLDNLDSTNGYRSRSTAWDWRRFVIGLTSERRLVRQTIEAAAASAHQAALGAGLPADAAPILADAVAAGTVERMNPQLRGDSNLALPMPPAGLWARARVAAAEAPELVDEGDDSEQADDELADLADEARTR